MIEKFFIVLTEAEGMYIAPHIPSELYKRLKRQHPNVAIGIRKESEIMEMEKIYFGEKIRSFKRIKTEVGPYLACYYEYELEV